MRNRYNLWRVNSTTGLEMDGETIAQTYAHSEEEAEADFKPLMEKERKYLILKA